jgi:hypothetical protein
MRLPCMPDTFHDAFSGSSRSCLLNTAASGGLKPAPAYRLRGAFPHHSCSIRLNSSSLFLAHCDRAHRTGLPLLIPITNHSPMLYCHSFSYTCSLARSGKRNIVLYSRLAFYWIFNPPVINLNGTLLPFTGHRASSFFWAGIADSDIDSEPDSSSEAVRFALSV